MNVAVYYRVSTPGQADDDKQGLPGQRDAVERYCTEHGYTVIATYEDKGYSGANAARPALAEMIEAAASGLFKAVVVKDRTRFARDAMLSGYLQYKMKQHGVALLSATETNDDDPQAKLLQGILDNVAEFERAMIVQRLHAARKLKKARGGYAGGKPRVGLMVSDGALVPNEAELVALKMAQRLRKDGKTYRAIAEALNDAGMRSRCGKSWAHSTVYAMLTRRA